MKTIFTLLILLFCVVSSHSQNDISIKLLEKPSNALSDSEHNYLFEIKNNSNKEFKNLNISVKNVSCYNSTSKSYKDESSSKKYKSNLDSFVLNKDKRSGLNQLNSKGQSTINFYVRLSTNKNTRLNSANCFEIFIKNNKGKGILSNVITIERLIPDPNDFN
ncbi:hypothetical protein [uncultured Algibacter sp.]|uniref:hypothetical protein n=1 Tax=uncultured Algibacter sp. TaxID=298659 RepID=UPI0030EE177F|tara:strand:+ start:254 stop:739 length:486 start_codon:yes stop_codon:yes gene_type:complete